MGDYREMSENNQSKKDEKIKVSRCSVWQNRGASDENGPKCCFGDGFEARAGRLTDDLSLVGVRTRIAGRGCLQRNKRRRHRRGLGRQTHQKRLSSPDKVKPVLSEAEKPSLRHENTDGLTDYVSVGQRQDRRQDALSLSVLDVPGVVGMKARRCQLEGTGPGRGGDGIIDRGGDSEAVTPLDRQRHCLSVSTDH